MAEIVNLRRARKARQRREKETAAEANRALYGEPPRLADLRRRRQEQAEARLEGHRRGTGDEAED